MVPASRGMMNIGMMISWMTIEQKSLELVIHSMVRTDNVQYCHLVTNSDMILLLRELLLAMMNIMS